MWHVRQAPFEGTAQELQLHAATLRRMVAKGTAQLLGKDKRGRLHYRILAETEKS